MEKQTEAVIGKTVYGVDIDRKTNKSISNKFQANSAFLHNFLHMKGGIMICSPCKNCHRKDLPKEKCARDCQILKTLQEMDSSSENINEGCGIDYTEEYGYHIPSMLTSNSYWPVHDPGY